VKKGAAEPSHYLSGTKRHSFVKDEVRDQQHPIRGLRCWITWDPEEGRGGIVKHKWALIEDRTKRTAQFYADKKK